MGRYLIRRTLFLVLVLFIVSLLTFLIFVKLPAGDPARRAVGRSTTPEQIAAAREAFGLDKPLYVQYGRFAKGLDPVARATSSARTSTTPTATSWRSRKRSIDGCRSRSRWRSGAAVIWLAMGVPIGIISAVRKGSIWDRAGMVFALIGVSMPVFWLGQLLLYFFWFQLGWAPSSGLEIGDSHLAIDREGQVHPALDHPRVHLGRVLRAHGARQPDRDDERGLHPHGSREGTRRTTRRLQARAARGADARS